MAGVDPTREAGERIEALLGELRSSGDPEVGGMAEELVRVVVALYGAGLQRVVEILLDGQVPAHPDGADGAGQRSSGAELLGRLAEDRLVSSLLVVHGLHPVDVDTRIQRALDSVRPYLGSHAGGVTYLGVDDAGVAHLQLQGSCQGCASSSVTVALAIETAVVEAAPEVSAVDVVGVAPPDPAPLLQIQPRPGTGAPERPGWAALTLPAELAPGELAAVDVEGVSVLLCAVDAARYAYLDACPECGDPPSSGRLAGSLLTCRGCGSTFDVRLAGRAVGGSGAHLEPLPLLGGPGALRVAIPTGATR